MDRTNTTQGITIMTGTMMDIGTGVITIITINLEIRNGKARPGIRKPGRAFCLGFCDLPEGRLSLRYLFPLMRAQ